MDVAPTDAAIDACTVPAEHGGRGLDSIDTTLVDRIRNGRRETQRHIISRQMLRRFGG